MPTSHALAFGTGGIWNRMMACNKLKRFMIEFPGEAVVMQDLISSLGYAVKSSMQQGFREQRCETMKPHSRSNTPENAQELELRT